MEMEHFFIVALAFWFEEGGSVTYFDHALDPPLVGSGRNTTASLTTQGGVGGNLPWFWIQTCDWSPLTPSHSYTRRS